MASPTSTFATLRALHLVIADALDDIQRVFAQTGLPGPPSSQCSSPVYPSFPDPSPVTPPFPTTPPASFPPTPLSATFPSSLRSPSYTDTGVPFVDYPSPDFPLASDSPGEQLALHPDAAAAASRIVAACGQMSNIVHKPFLSVCDAILSYNLPACMRLVEHLHVAEILREAEENRQRCLASGQEAVVPLSGAGADLNGGASEPISTTLKRDAVDIRTPAARVERMPGSRAHTSTEGLHVTEITNVICSYAGRHYIDPSDLVHALRLLSTHHIFRETAPDIFALNRVASLLDSRKSVKAVFSIPESKYEDTDGIPAFVALTTDELFKSAAYLTEAFTGVQLPIRASIPNSPRTDAVSSTAAIPPTPSSVISDSVPSAPTTRSSSALTHIMYPEDEDAQPHSRQLLSTEAPENIRSCPPQTGVPVASQPLVTEFSVPSSPRSSPVEASIQMEESLRPGDTAKPEKLPAFNLAFCTSTPFFDWLENEGKDPLGGTGQGACIRAPVGVGGVIRGDAQLVVPGIAPNCVPQKSFRLERFSKAMTGTTGWEAPKAILGGFDWFSLPKGSTIVDVGGGIGSTTMILAHALNGPGVDSVEKLDSAHDEGLQPTTARQMSRPPSDPSLVAMASDEPRNDTAAKSGSNLLFVVQDRPVVASLGIEAWRSKHSEMLESGQVTFQDQNFFEPQSPFGPPHLSRHPAVYLLRVVLHDWPDEFARRILINLRIASNPETRLVIAEHVLPLACADEDVLDHVNTEICEGNSTEEWTLNSVLANIEGAERTLVPPPLLSNLGKASANAYWMDLLMHISLNGKERTLREFCALALSAGWRITRMTRAEGSLFAYLVCEPITVPEDARAIYNAINLSPELSTAVAAPADERVDHSHMESCRHKRLPARPLSLLPSPILERSSSRCGTPTFGSRILLPKDEELQSPRTRGAGAAKKWLKSKGLGVRSVVMQKAEKQREEQNGGVSMQGNSDVQSRVPSSPSHMRVWWKKSPPNSTSSSSIAVHELNGEVPEHRTAGGERRRTIKSSASPSTPNPRVSPVHQHWPSTESASQPQISPPVPRARRPSVASITRKLSFATFGRRPSTPDVTEPLPTPPPSASWTELAPPPILQGETGRSLKHLPSMPTLGRSEVTTSTTAGKPAIPRHPSLNFAGQVPPLQPTILKATPPRRPDIADSPKSSILKSRTSPNASQQSSPDTGHSTESTSIPRRQRRVTLSNSPGASSGSQGQSPGSVSVPSDPVGPDVRRIPSVPKLPRRLSIPMLRRKQGQSVVQDTENEG